jgi:hypothetical protein
MRLTNKRINEVIESLRKKIAVIHLLNEEKDKSKMENLKREIELCLDWFNITDVRLEVVEFYNYITINDYRIECTTSYRIYNGSKLLYDTLEISSIVTYIVHLIISEMLLNYKIYHKWSE